MINDCPNTLVNSTHPNRVHHHVRFGSAKWWNSNATQLVVHGCQISALGSWVTKELPVDVHCWHSNGGWPPGTGTCCHNVAVQHNHDTCIMGGGKNARMTPLRTQDNWFLGLRASSGASTCMAQLRSAIWCRHTSGSLRRGLVNWDLSRSVV